jgi:hypothetical protein
MKRNAFLFFATAILSIMIFAGRSGDSDNKAEHFPG